MSDLRQPPPGCVIPNTVRELTRQMAETPTSLLASSLTAFGMTGSSGGKDPVFWMQFCPCHSEPPSFVILARTVRAKCAYPEYLPLKHEIALNRRNRSVYAHLMRTVLAKMTRLGICACFKTNFRRACVFAIAVRLK